MVTALATIGLIVIAFFGLKAIGVAKRQFELTTKQMVHRAKRESRLYAVERCEQFAEELIPRSRAILQGLASEGLDLFVRSPTDIKFEGVDRNELERAEEWVARLPNEVRNLCIATLNALEAWASPFCVRIADAGVAFGPCAPPFCSMVTQNYAVLIVLREREQSGAFPYVVKLFTSWRKQLYMPQILEQVDDAFKKAAEAAKAAEDDGGLEPPIGL